MTVTPLVCVDEGLLVSQLGVLQIAPWAVPRVVADVMATASTRRMWETKILPGIMLMESEAEWLNETPVDHMVCIKVHRGRKSWVTSNPNVIQFRDRWSWGIDQEPSEPVTSGYFNSQAGGGGDLGTNSVAEPNPGKFWVWRGASSADEWVGPIEPGQILRVRYRMYVWTPPPFSDNANKNSPDHQAFGGFARVQLVAFPDQGRLVTG